VSATHLEYREAKKAGIPVLMYARDKTLAEFDVWRKAGEPDAWEGPWVEKDHKGLFGFLKERREDEKENWCWPFRDSVELKGRLRRDLGKASGTALIERLLDRGILPLLALNVRGANYIPGQNAVALDAYVVNCGGGAAVDVVMTAPSLPGWQHRVGTVSAADYFPLKTRLPVRKLNGSQVTVAEIMLRHTTPQGLEIADCGQLVFPHGVQSSVPPFWQYQAKRLLRRRVFAIEIEEDEQRARADDGT
jgi:hypothetical protein